MALKSREKILTILVIIAVAIWAFDRFYYTPQIHKMKLLEAEVKGADLKLNESLLLTKGIETLEAEIIRQEGDLARLSERTLKGEEFRTFLKHLAKESDSLQMKVISLTPRKKNFPPLRGKRKLLLRNTGGSISRWFSIQPIPNWGRI